MYQETLLRKQCSAPPLYGWGEYDYSAICLFLDTLWNS